MTPHFHFQHKLSPPPPIFKTNCNLRLYYVSGWLVRGLKIQVTPHTWWMANSHPIFTYGIEFSFTILFLLFFSSSVRTTAKYQVGSTSTEPLCQILCRPIQRLVKFKKKKEKIYIILQCMFINFSLNVVMEFYCS